MLEVSQAHTGLAIIFILAAITTVMTTLTLVGRRSQAIPDHDTWWQRQWLKYEPRLQWMISVMVLVLVLAELVHPGILWRLCRQLGLV